MKNKTQLFLLQFGNTVFTPDQKGFIKDNYKKCYILDSHIAETEEQSPKFIIHLKLNTKTNKLFKNFKLYTNGQVNDTKRTSVLEVPLDPVIYDDFVHGRYRNIPMKSNLSKTACDNIINDLDSYTKSINKFYNVEFEPDELAHHSIYCMPPTTDTDSLNSEKIDLISKLL